MKILISNSKNFDKTLDSLLYIRKKKIISDKVSVIKIINDVKNNGDNNDDIVIEEILEDDSSQVPDLDN